MKRLLSVLLFSLATGASAQDIFDYTVFAKGYINAECGDFLGRTGARGNISLRDFLVKDDASNGCRSGCPLESGADLRTTRGSVQDLTGYSCMAGKQIFIDQTGARDFFYPSVDFNQVADQMDRLSARLARPRPHGVRVIDLAPCDLFPGKLLNLEAKPQELLVINLRGKSFNFDRVGMKLLGGATPGNVIWNFIDATEIVLKNTGTRATINGEEIGVPGMILAPFATLYGNTARVTGAVYVNNFIGTGASESCTGATSLQVNPMPLAVVIPCENSCGNGGKGQR